MSQSDTLSTMPAIRSLRAVPLALEILIEVPELKGARTRRGPTQPHWRASGSHPLRTAHAAPIAPRGSCRGMCAHGSHANRLGLHHEMVESAQSDRRVFYR